MSFTINFKNEDFFTYEQLKTYLQTISSYDKSVIMCAKINKLCYVNDNKLYVLQSNNTFKCILINIDQTLLMIVGSLFSKSVGLFSNESNELLISKYGKQYKIAISNSSIKSVIEYLKTMLRNEDIVIDNTLQQIHFKNGYIDINKNKFLKRDKPFYITKFINRDYKPSTKDEREEYMNILKQIYPKKTDRDLIITCLSTALSGKATLNNHVLFLIGKGATGKSSIINSLGNCLDVYYKTLKSDSFSNDRDINKVLNTYLNEPQILLTCINEMDSKRIKTDVFKNFTEGYCETTQLYKESSHSFRHHSLCIGTSNELPNMRQDTGIKRRVVAYEHKSLFTNDEKKVDEKNHVYKADVNLEIKFKRLNNAIIDIFSKRCYDWLKGDIDIDFSTSNNIQESTDLVNESDDYFQDFIDSKLKITNNDKDRISKEEMRQEFLEMYKDKRMNIKQIISALKDKNIVYNGAYRSNGIRGCFVGVKFSDDDDDYMIIDDEDQTDYYRDKYEEMIKKNEQLLQRIKDLENNTDTESDLSNDIKKTDKKYKKLQLKMKIDNKKNKKKEKKKVVISKKKTNITEKEMNLISDLFD